MEINNLAVIVSSCDAYEEAWRPFFELFFRFWHDCPYPVYLVTESKTYPDSRVRPLLLNDPSWATRLKHALDVVSEPTVLYVQEDYFLKRSVDTARIRELVRILQSEKVASIRVYPDPAPQVPYKTYAGLGEVVRGTPYRLSLQATLWDASCLQNLLIAGDNPWNTEHAGSRRSDAVSQPFLSVKRSAVLSGRVSPVFEYVCTGISKRLWTWDAIYLFRAERINVERACLGTESYAVYVRRRLRQIPWVGGLFRRLYRVEYKIMSLFSASFARRTKD